MEVKWMKEYELNVDPRILELLGPNLYTNIYYVLAELIANAYDADAKNVYFESKLWTESFFSRELLASIFLESPINPSRISLFSNFQLFKQVSL